MNDHERLTRLFRRADWMTDAPCAGRTDIYYPIQHGNGERDAIQQAKAICNECPNRIRCLEYAIDNGEDHGIWGGYSVRQRRRIAADRRAMGWTTGRYRNIPRNDVA